MGERLQTHLRVVSAREPRDAQVDRAVAAMRADPRRRWTVASLGRVAGLSRAAFARRFEKAMGAPPLRCLTEHRMRLAEERLRQGDEPLVVIAGDVGYACEFAFAKAFKRWIGVAPGAFRRGLGARETFRAAA